MKKEKKQKKNKKNIKKDSLLTKIKNKFDTLKKKITKDKVSNLLIYKKYKDKADESVKIKKRINNYYKRQLFSVNFVRVFYILLVLFFIISIFYIVNKVKEDAIERERLHVVSEKPYERFSEKEKKLIEAQEKLNEYSDLNLLMKGDNLNFAYRYDTVLDDEDKKYVNSNYYKPEPLSLNEEYMSIDIAKESVAYQVYQKLKMKNDLYIIDLQKMVETTNPVSIVRKYNYSGFKILGNYNPKNKTHSKGRYVTYFIDKFSNVNIHFLDGDGAPMEEYQNIKDIMSMGSVYTYYQNKTDYKSYLNYCYDLFDRSYSNVASISEVYYCSGCMNYDDPNIENRPVSINHIPKSLYEQKVDNDIYEQKAGNLEKMDLHKIEINDYTYDDYVEEITMNGHNKLYNYCPGHIDLEIYVTCLCLNNKNSLLNIDNYGNSGRNYIETWHGWEKTMINKALSLTNKDWYHEYGFDIDKIDYLKPLPRELINYYLCTLSDDISKDRKQLIQTALESVSKIPYYYGGKPHTYGYGVNGFNVRKRPDYSGRVLNGLDCSGWITWVYWTAFSKKLVKGEGTVGLAKEGTRIVRSELQPGDLIVRPGYDSHVMMFLSWEEGGKVKVIHENGSVNNVSIATYEAYYPYYRKIFTK